MANHLDAVDAFRAYVEKAADAWEALANDVETMKNAAIGVLPDGTPVDDMLDELKEVKAENARLLETIRNLKHLAWDCKLSDASSAIKAIRNYRGN